MDPKLYTPHLDAFLNDECLPNAILLSYIRNMEQLAPSNYTKERGENFAKGLDEIHKALIDHSDPHPRNMMVLKDDPSRAICIDFDRAQT